MLNRVDTTSKGRSDRSRILECEQPLHDLRTFAAAIAALSIVNSDELPGVDGTRDLALSRLAHLVYEGAEQIEASLDLMHKLVYSADEGDDANA